MPPRCPGDTVARVVASATSPVFPGTRQASRSLCADTVSRRHSYQMTDDEKFLWKDLTLEECHRLAFENAKVCCASEHTVVGRAIWVGLAPAGATEPASAAAVAPTPRALM